MSEQSERMEIAFTDLLDADGRQLAKGHVYKIASAPDCRNRFRCVALHNPNGTMFVREHDGMVHLGREFIGYRDGVRYYDVSDTSNKTMGGGE
jgi:hypothetical protein